MCERVCEQIYRSQWKGMGHCLISLTKPNELIKGKHKQNLVIVFKYKLQKLNKRKYRIRSQARAHTHRQTQLMLYVNKKNL